MATQIKNILSTWPKWKRRIFILIIHTTYVFSICLALSSEFFILKIFFFLFLLLLLLLLLDYNYNYYYYLYINLFSLFLYLFIFLFIYLLITYLFQWQQNIRRPIFHFLFNSLCTCVHSIFINHHPSFLISSFHPSIGGEFKTLSSSGLVYPYPSIVWASRLR